MEFQLCEPAPEMSVHVAPVLVDTQMSPLFAGAIAMTLPSDDEVTECQFLDPGAVCLVHTYVPTEAKLVEGTMSAAINKTPAKTLMPHGRNVLRIITLQIVTVFIPSYT